MLAYDERGAFKPKLFNYAIDLGTRRYRAGKLPPHLSLVDALLDKLVRSKVKARFGGRLKAMVSGGAPLNEEVGLFFLSLGLPVLQGYGQTEASPVISANPPGRSKIDTVGPPLPGVGVRIAEDGEILVRGDSVMLGYWDDPEATSRTIIDGWLYTGDIGELDQDGYLKITDRKKDIIVNSGGDNISPQRVEGLLSLSPEIGQAIVFGDRKPFLVALVVPDPEFSSLVPNRDTPSETRARISDAIQRTNQSLAQIERVRNFLIIDEAFSVENRMMTPTMKLRRGVIREHYSSEIEALYRNR